VGVGGGGGSARTFITPPTFALLFSVFTRPQHLQRPMPPKTKKTVRGAVDPPNLCACLTCTIHNATSLLFPVQKKRGRPSKADDGHDARLKTEDDVAARNKAEKGKKPRCVLRLREKQAVSSDKHGMLGPTGVFSSQWDALDAMDIFLHKVNGILVPSPSSPPPLPSPLVLHPLSVSHLHTNLLVLQGLL
jgi:hypothetical protein